MSTPRSTRPEVAPAVQLALECLGERRTLVSVAIYDKPIPTPLIQLLLRERRIQGTICYNSDDYRAVIDLMARRHSDTTGWVETIPLSGVVQQGFEGSVPVWPEAHDWSSPRGPERCASTGADTRRCECLRSVCAARPRRSRTGRSRPGSRHQW